MSERPLISVLILAYNQEATIGQTIDSILNQNHASPYEIIIGDDCSKDNTGAVIKEYAEKYPDIIRIQINEKNLGLIKNYFSLISLCQGEIIMECAGDDFWLPNKIETQIPVFNDPAVGLCYGKAKTLNVSTGKFGNSIGAQYTKLTDLIKANPIPALTAAFRKELIDRYVAEIAPQQRDWLTEDYPFWLWIAGRKSIVFINEDLAVYRIVEDSVSRQETQVRAFKFELQNCCIRSFYAQLYAIDYDFPFYKDSLARSYSRKSILKKQNVADSLLLLHEISKPTFLDRFIHSCIRMPFFGILVVRTILSKGLMYRILRKIKRMLGVR